MPAVGDPDGYGRYGILEETKAGLTCAECAWTGRHLGLHVYEAHGLTADAYRVRHGLKRGRGLVAAATRQIIQANARAGIHQRALFRQRRDPAAATRRRLQLGQPASPEAAAERDTRMSVLGKESAKSSSSANGA